MLDVMPLVAAVDQLAERLRAMPQSALRRGAAAAGRTVAAQLAERARRLEPAGSGPAEEVGALPDAGEFAVGDQLAVTGHDLAEALRRHGTAAELAAAERLLAEGAATVRAAARP